MATARRFRDFWRRIGAIGPWEPHYERLAQLYLEPHRRYHTLDHIAFCLRILEEHRRLATEPDEVEGALWWHDAIYVPLHNGKPVKNNEELSAELANAALKAGNVPEGRRSRIVSHILATKHTGTQLVGSNVTLVADIDMSILGARWDDYVKYMAGIEREYRYDGSLSEIDYINGRILYFLTPMMLRQTIFHTPEFAARFDTRARQNMADEFERLQNRLMHLAT